MCLLCTCYVLTLHDLLYLLCAGEHVAGSPTLLEVAAGGAAPGRCYARGEGVETQQILCSGRQPHRFAIVACDATGLPRSHGGDAFEVRVLPHGHAHHVAPTTVTVRSTHGDSTPTYPSCHPRLPPQAATICIQVYDQGDGVHAVEWLPPFSGDYLVHVRLGGGLMAQGSRLSGARARPLSLLGARLAALGGSALPG